MAKRKVRPTPVSASPTKRARTTCKTTNIESSLNAQVFQPLSPPQKPPTAQPRPTKPLKKTIDKIRQSTLIFHILDIFVTVLPDRKCDLFIQTLSPPTFHPFKRLPPELRSRIWKLCLPTPKVVDLSAKFYITPHAKPHIYSPLLSTCVESRHQILRKYILLPSPLGCVHVFPRYPSRARKWMGVVKAPMVLWSPTRDEMKIDMFYEELSDTMIVDGGHDEESFVGWLQNYLAGERRAVLVGLEMLVIRDWYGEVVIEIHKAKECGLVKCKCGGRGAHVWMEATYVLKY